MTLSKKFKFRLAVFLIVTVFTVQQARAVLPLVYAAVFGAVDATTALTTSQAIGTALIGIGSAALIGQRLGIIGVNGKDSNNNDIQINIPLTRETRDRPISNPQLPATAAALPAQTTANKSCPTEPSSAAFGGTCSGTFTYTYVLNSAQSACDRHFTKTFTTGGCTSFSGVNAGFTPYVNICDTNYTVSGGNCNLNAGVDPCPNGYTTGTGNCLLTAPQVVPDSKIGFTQDANNNFVIDTTDGDYDAALQSPDFSYSAAAVAFKIAHPTYVDGYPPNYWGASDSPPAVNVQISDSVASAGGSGSIAGACPYAVCIPVAGLPGHFRISAMSNTASGNSQLVAIDVNKSTGIVTQVNTVPLNGTLLSAGSIYTNTAGQSVAVPSNQLVLATTAGGTYTQAQTNAIPAAVVNFPSDLAKTGEAAVAAGTINTTLNEHLTGTQDFVAPAQASINNSYDIIEDSLTPNPADLPEIELSWLPSFMPGNFQACVPFVFSVNPTFGAAAGLTGVGEIDICDKLGLARALFGWFLGVLTVFFVFRAFIRSNMGV